MGMLDNSRRGFAGNCRLRLEQLEERRLLSIVPGYCGGAAVTNTSDVYALDIDFATSEVIPQQVGQLMTNDTPPVVALPGFDCAILPGGPLYYVSGDPFLDDPSVLCTTDFDYYEINTTPPTKLSVTELGNLALADGTGVWANALEWSPKTATNPTPVLYGAGEDALGVHRLFSIDPVSCLVAPLVDLSALGVESAGDIAFDLLDNLYLSLDNGNILQIDPTQATPVVTTHTLSPAAGQPAPSSFFDSLLGHDEPGKLIGVTRAKECHVIDLTANTTTPAGMLENPGIGLPALGELLTGVTLAYQVPDNLGAITMVTEDLGVTPIFGQRWYEFSAVSDGFITVELLGPETFDSGIEVYNTVDDAPVAKGHDVVHVLCAAGQTYYVHASGLAYQQGSDFRFSPGTASVGSQVWNDLNQNGLQDDGPTGVVGMTVALVNAGADGLAHTYDDVPMGTRTTDIGGEYLFEKLPAGSYYLVFSGLPTDYIFTSQDAGVDDAVDSDANPTTGETAVFALPADASAMLHDAGIFLDMLDFGDAPDNNYLTLLASNGARHVIGPDFFLGDVVDAEDDGKPNAAATGDDQDNWNDDDGVRQALPLVPGQTASFTVAVTNPNGRDAYLDAWLDLNGDGYFLVTEGEHVVDGLPVSDGPNTVSFTLPANAVAGETFMRFRFSSSPNLLSYGLAVDGEVEDYVVEIEAAGSQFDYGDAPGPLPVLFVDNGARHDMGDLYMGQSVDFEPDGQPSEDGKGDDELWSDMGLHGFWQMEIGEQNTASILCHTGSVAQGYYNIWIDFNQNGSWDDAGERVATNVPATMNKHTAIPFTVPGSALPGCPAGRVRLSDAPLDSYLGHGGLGEVEDFRALVLPFEPEHDLGDAPDSTNHFGLPMTAYPAGSIPGSPDAVEADFPTVYGESAPYGPRHDFPDVIASLGAVSREDEADREHDEDGQPYDTINNIYPGGDSSNRDGGDQSVDTWFGQQLDHGRENTVWFEVDVHLTPAGPLYVNIWYDWSRDGDWDDAYDFGDGRIADEWAVQNQELNLTDGKYNVESDPFLAWHPTVGTFDGLDVAPTWMRITLADQPWASTGGEGYGGCGPEGGYSVGETEDYYITHYHDTVDYGDAPVSYGTLSADDGARHAINGPYLGPDVDDEIDGRPDPNAIGDDSQHDDEDGVDFGNLFAGLQSAVDVTVNGGGGYVDAWIDFNRDGLFDPNEQIHGDWLDDGTHEIQFDVPAGASIGNTYARFRISTEGDLDPTGPAFDGEVEDHMIPLTSQPFDYGDAPDSYGTTWASNGARHFLGDGGPWFGTNPPDSEADGQPNATATGDDNNGTVDDEDGFAFEPLQRGRTNEIWFTVGGGGHVDAWIDFDGNGIFEADELIESAEYLSGFHTLNVDVPVDAVFGNTMARFRISTAGSPDPTGPADNGEVEDHMVSVVLPPTDFGDAPLPYPTLYADNGARHLVDYSGPRMGVGTPDAEQDGQPSTTASGDDTTDFDDEEGVTFTSGLWVGEVAEIAVKVTAAGKLDAWVDFNDDGDWLDANEQIFTGLYLDVNDHTLNFQVPEGPFTTDLTYARFRFSTVGGLAPTGPANDGEVEDYAVAIQSELTADLVVDPNPALYDHAVTLYADGSTHTDPGRSIVEYYWDFGDITAYAETPDYAADGAFDGVTTHVYAQPGVYLATVTVTDDSVPFKTDLHGTPIDVRGLDFGDAPDPTYPTLLASNGARHLVVDGFHLGAAIDTETDGQPNATATGDDVLDASDDEDGVTFTSALEAGQTATVTVNASAAGMLDAWIDLNADGDWLDAGEQVFTSEPLLAGDNLLTYHVQFHAVDSEATFARFRFSSTGGLAPDGPADDGEVEDYAVEVFAAPDLGVVDYWDSGELDPASDRLVYKFKAAHDGIISVELIQGAGAETGMTLHDPALGWIWGSWLGTGRLEMDDAVADIEYYLQVSGVELPAQLIICNLLEPVGSDLIVHGTDGDDAFSVNTGSGGSLTINNASCYPTALPAFSTITVDAGPGNDTLSVIGGGGTEWAIMEQGAASIASGGVQVDAVNQEFTYFTADSPIGSWVELHDSPGDDFFFGGPEAGTGTNEAIMSDAGGSYQHGAYNVGTVRGYATGGHDMAMWDGVAGAKDEFKGKVGYSALSGPDYYLWGRRFEEVTATGQDATDLAKLYDGPDDDALVADPTAAKLKYAGSETKFVQADGFRVVQALATYAGIDTAELHDSAMSADRIVGLPEASRLYGPGFYNRAVGFETIDAYAHAGDIVKLYDSLGNDTFACGPDFAHMQYDGGPLVQTHGTTTNLAFSRAGGLDTANMQDAAATADRLIGTADYAKLRGPGFFTKAIGFDKLTATATPGQADVALLYDDIGSDIFEAGQTTAKMSYNGSAAHFTQADGFRYVHGLAYAVDTPGAVDRAYLTDSAGDDVMKAYPDYVKLYNNTVGFYNRARLFDEVHATGGGLLQNDVALLYDSVNDDRLEYGGSAAQVFSTDTVHFLNEASQFKRLRPRNGAGGLDDKFPNPMTLGYDLDDSLWL